MKFQRNYEPISRANFSRRVILLVMVVGGMLIFFFLLTKRFTIYKAPAPVVVHLSILDDNTFIVEEDTTNYEKLASVLRKEITALRKQNRPIEIWMQIPKKAKAGELKEVLMLGTAFEDVKMQLKSK